MQKQRDKGRGKNVGLRNEGGCLPNPSSRFGKIGGILSTLAHNPQHGPTGDRISGQTAAFVVCGFFFA